MIYTDLKTLYQNNGAVKELVFLLLGDYQTDRSLNEKLRNTKVRNASSCAQYYFEKIKDNYNKEKNNSKMLEKIKTKNLKFAKETTRKNNKIPYIKPVTVWRFKIASFLKIFYPEIHFSEETAKKIEVLFYPRDVRRYVFSEENYLKNHKDIYNIIFNFLAEDFICNFVSILVNPIRKNPNGTIDARGSVVDFSKNVNRERTPEELSKSIWLVGTSGLSSLCLEDYLSFFVDKDFIFDLVKTFKNILLAKRLRDLIDQELIRVEEPIEKQIEKRIQKAEQRGEKPFGIWDWSIKDKRTPSQYISDQKNKVIVSLRKGQKKYFEWSGILPEDFKRWQYVKSLRFEIDDIIKDLEKNSFIYITKESFFPVIEKKSFFQK